MNREWERINAMVENVRIEISKGELHQNKVKNRNVTDFCHVRINLWFTTEFPLGIRAVLLDQSGV